MLKGRPENIGTALVKLQAQFAVGNIKLKEHMTGWKVHVGQIGHVPRANDNSPRIGMMLYHIHRFRNLVYVSAIVIGHERH